MRDAVAFDVHPAHRGGVEQHVHQMVVQQVHLVDVEHAVVSGGQQAGTEGLLAVTQHPFQIERADHAVLGGADRQFHQPSRRAPVSSTTGGSSWASARTTVDLAVPFSPRTSTPPMPGCTAHKISASCSRSCPTTAENGNPASSPAPVPLGERPAADDDSAVSTCDTDTHRL